ncbi:MAG: hypothetical protein K6B13_08155, partial [Prevotella sp.]|nr:hypothetical protein [Prevotella sp.]
RGSEEVTDPTPAPPLEGRGVPHGVPAAGKAIAIVPNEKNNQFVFLVFLVFIGFYWFFLRPLRGIIPHR